MKRFLLIIICLLFSHSVSIAKSISKKEAYKYSAEELQIIESQALMSTNNPSFVILDGAMNNISNKQGQVKKYLNYSKNFTDLNLHNSNYLIAKKLTSTSE